MTYSNECPNCGNMMVGIECLDEEYDEVGIYCRSMEGQCPICGRRFEWIEKFEYTGVVAMREIAQNEDYW